MTSGIAEDAPLLPPPALLLGWKHHAGVIRQRIAAVVAAGPPALVALPPRLLAIGESQMDLYYGDLGPAAIAAAVIADLRASERFEESAYRAWLAAQSGYATLAIADGSRWVLRLGTAPGRYLHLHPARYAPHTLRARSAPLKMAIAALAWSGIYGGDPLDPAVINAARRAVLNLGPLAAPTSPKEHAPPSQTDALIGLLRPRGPEQSAVSV